MGRMYKAEDKVIVYANEREYEAGAKLHGFKQKPYAMNGYNNYLYKGIMYTGFQDRSTDEVYILLDKPVNPPTHLGA